MTRNIASMRIRRRRGRVLPSLRNALLFVSAMRGSSHLAHPSMSPVRISASVISLSVGVLSPALIRSRIDIAS